DRRVRLATHEWADGAVSPEGYTLLDGFDIEDGVPRWRWSFGPIALQMEIAMVHGRSAVGVRFELLRAGTAGSVGLEVEALATCTANGAHGVNRPSRRRPTGSCSKITIACAAPASSPAASGIAACAVVKKRPAASTPSKTCGSPGASPPPCSRARSSTSRRGP